jgi:Zn-dependent peptidase ImmA (M78 family)
MFFFLDKIAALSIGWNERPLSETDFYRLCKRFKIRVVEMPLRTNGFYYRLRGKDFIAVDSGLAGPQRLLVLFHELGHFLFHTPESGATANFHGVGRRTRQEREADMFALCSLIPKSWIETRSAHQLIDDDGFSSEIVAERCAIFAQHGV